MLDVRHLRILAAVADSGSMTRAAARLSYTASAVSQQMAALERQLGTPLFVRHARGVRLTEAGRLLCQHAGQVDDQLRRAEQEVRDLIELRTGRLRLGAFVSASSRLIPDAITEFRHRHPEITLSLDILDPLMAVEAVAARRLDVGVVFDYPPDPVLDFGDLVQTPLLDDPVLVALPPGHDRSDAELVSVRDLAAEPWIRDCSPDPMCRDMLDRFCREGGFSPTIAFEADNYLTIGRLVEAGVAVALVPGLAVDQLPAAVAVRPLGPRVVRRVSAVHRPGSAPAVERMLEVLAEAGTTSTAGTPT